MALTECSILSTPLSKADIKATELNTELVELEKALADSQVLQERQIVQDEVDGIKAKLDKAKAMGAISDEDYAARLAQANKKLDHFTEIRMLKKQKARLPNLRPKGFGEGNRAKL